MTEPQAIPPDVQGWLATIRMEWLCQWDVVVFLYRHQTILMSPEHLARLMGYPTATMLAALDTLAAQGLVERSPHSSAAVCLYRFAEPSEPARRHALEQLLAISEHRSGRLLLCKYLRRGDRSPREGLDSARRMLEDAKRVGEIARRHSEDIGRTIRQRAERQRERERNEQPNAGRTRQWPSVV